LITNPEETEHRGCAMFDGNYTTSKEHKPVCAICFDGYMDSKIVDIDGNMKFICMNDFCMQG
jgi:alpha-D-ribose 1-methylphosphonate 5-phosphate C-P lyase